MATGREDKKADVRDRLYKAAISLFERDGYDAVSVAQIVAEAGVAKGTFFNHFPSKAHIVAAWYRGLIDAALSDAGKGAGRDIEKRLCDMALTSVRVAARHPALWLAKRQEIGSSPVLQDIEAKSDARLAEAVARAIDEARQDGAIRADADARTLASLFITLVTGTIHEWSVTGARGRLETRLKNRCRAFCALLAPPR